MEALMNDNDEENKSWVQLYEDMAYVSKFK